MNHSAGDGLPRSGNAVLFPLAAEGRRTKATCPSLGPQHFKSKLELEVKRKGVNWMRDLTTV